MTKPRKRPAPLSLRLTPTERQHLERLAAGTSLSAYIKSCLFKPDGRPAQPRQSRGKFPVKDQVALATLLARFGQSEIAANLSEVARLARNGSFPITSETEAALRATCRDVRTFKDLLIRALGLTP